jgi:hypothetical protein
MSTSFAIARACAAPLLAGATLFAAVQEAPPRPDVKPPQEPVTPLPIPEGAPDGIRELVAELAKEGATIDFERGIVAVKGAFLLERMQAEYPIEYLIVAENGFAHEALAMVRVTPSRLNAAFLALGLEGGRTVQFARREPLPPLEKLITGEEREFDITPPAGPVVDVVVRWEDEAGEHLHPIEDLIVYVTNRQPLPRRGFVFVGSRFSKLILDGERVERFMADVEGNLVALYISGFGNCLFDMNSEEGIEAHLYDVNSSLVPKSGTVATFEFRLRRDPPAGR